MKCVKCDSIKLQTDFYPHKTRKNGFDNYCKECRKAITIAAYCPKRAKRRKLRYLVGWREFFITEYGTSPQCQVCSKILYWEADKSSVVHWDHRHGQNRYQPSDFTYSRPCNDKNIAVWRDLDFGMLCHSCNKNIPTKDREEWVRRVNQYVFGDEAVTLHCKQTNLADGLDWDY